MSIQKRFYCGFLLIFLAACTSQEEQAIIDQKVLDKAQVTAVLDEVNAYSNSQKSTQLNQLARKLLADSALLWSDGYLLAPVANELAELTQNAIKLGLDSSFFNPSELQQLVSQLKTDTGNSLLLAKAEWEFSKTAIQLCTQVKYGFLNHEQSDSMYFQWKYDSLKSEDIEWMKQGIKENNLEKSIAQLEPQFVGYKLLKKSWSKFVNDQDFGFDKVLVSSMKEDSTKAYNRAKQALLVSQFLDSASSENDSLFLEKLKEFQIHHGLTPDARVGRATAYALSRNNADRKLSVMASLEKYKWEKFDEDSLLFVNIPSYNLYIIEQNEIKDTYRGVVGKTINRTPTFSANMQYLILNPYWHIPRSISSKEILPKLKKDSNLVKKKGYAIYDKNRNKIDASKVDWSKVTTNSFNYRISQTRSGGTALGKVKFIFTNKYSIYFHDTPSKHLFKNDVRAYSHGCVRIQNPLKLASYLMSRVDSNYTLDSVQNFVKRGIQKRINLNYPLKVSLRYFSCEGTEEGNVVFYRDIYKKETEIKAVIEELIYSKSE